MMHGIFCWKRKETNSWYRRSVRYDKENLFHMIAINRPGMDWSYVGVMNVTEDGWKEICLQYLDEPWPVKLRHDI